MGRISKWHKQRVQVRYYEKILNSRIKSLLNVIYFIAYFCKLNLEIKSEIREKKIQIILLLFNARIFSILK